MGIAIEGCVNTYMRTGKLFPGPHLYAGAAIVGLWAAAAALVPAMQKGDQNARNAHIALNAANVALFAWQVGATGRWCRGSKAITGYIDLHIFGDARPPAWAVFNSAWQAGAWGCCWVWGVALGAREDASVVGGAKRPPLLFASCACPYFWLLTRPCPALTCSLPRFVPPGAHRPGDCGQGVPVHQLVGVGMGVGGVGWC